MSTVRKSLRWMVAAPLILVAADCGLLLSQFEQDFDLEPAGTFNGNVLLMGVGSGAFHDRFAHPDDVWTITDRGPNGDHPDGSKIFPTPSFTPTIFHLRIHSNHYEILKAIPIKDQSGNPITGLPTLGTETALFGNYAPPPLPDPPFPVLPKDPEGLDTEAIVRLRDGSFWISEEYWGLVHVGPNGRVLRRVVPAGTGANMFGADYPIDPSLPAILAKRRLNRGLESIAVSDDEKHLYILYQNPLDNPDSGARNLGNARFFKLRLKHGGVTPVGEWVYPMDAGDTFGRLLPDGTLQGDPVTSRIRDVKISEIVCVGKDKLVVLERLEKTTKLYFVDLDDGASNILGPWDDPAGNGGLHLELIADLPGAGITPLGKRLLFNSLDDLPQLRAKQESLAYLGHGVFQLINDNDFSINGDFTQFTRIWINPDLLD